MIIGAIVAVAIIATVGTVLLYLASRDMLPAGLGLLDMGQDVNRVLVFVGLLIIVALLTLLYRRVRANPSKEDVNADS